METSKELRSCYTVRTSKQYDEFAAMLGSEEDIEQAPGKFDGVLGPYDDEHRAFDAFRAETSRLVKAQEDGTLDGTYRAVLRRHGPRGKVVDLSIELI